MEPDVVLPAPPPLIPKTWREEFEAKLADVCASGYGEVTVKVQAHHVLEVERRDRVRYPQKNT